MTQSSSVEIVSLVDGAATISGGTALVIDVFRAFTTAAVAFDRGAKKIFMVDSLDQALALRDSGKGTTCMGERDGLKPDSFDFGNNPMDLLDHRFDGQALIQTTTNGTRGLHAAKAAEVIYATSFAIADATVKTAQKAGRAVTCAAMGDHNAVRKEEDELCAFYLRARLMDRQPDFEAMREVILTAGKKVDGVRMTDAEVDFCLTLNRYHFAIRVTQEEGLMVARPERA